MKLVSIATGAIALGTLIACAGPSAKSQGTPAAAVPAKGGATAPKSDERPPFREDMGALKWQSVLPDLGVETADGKPAKLHDYTGGGKATLIVMWDGSFGPGAEVLPRLEKMASTYRAQGLKMVGIGTSSTRAQFEKWQQDNRGAYSFPVAFDPSGPVPGIEKEYDDLTPQEQGDYNRRINKFIETTLIGRLSGGGGFVPMPMFIMVDGQNRMLGWSTAMGDRLTQGAGNLLVRAGFTLEAQDMPRRVFTHQETKTQDQGPRVEMLRVGATAPDFTTFDLDGKPVKLSDYRGRVIVLDFWATWCTPCIASMPHTQETARSYKEQGVVVLGVCTQDERAKFDEWVQANRQKYPDFIFSHDPAERTPARISNRLYGVSGIPTQFVIGRDGKIADVVVGYRKGEVILDGALARAGVQVDPAIVAQAEQDKKNRRIASGAAETM